MACGNCGGGIVHGAIGLAKVGAQLLGVPVDEADAATAQSRLAACRDCEHATRNPDRLDRPTKGITTLSTCTLCGCFLKGKVRVASETCPAGKW